ncbi:MAG: hypothetical protein RH917_06180 [Lacipirellulaceae bacterium]
MGKLTNILQQSSLDSIKNAWDSTEAAGETAAIPSGEYVAHITSGELINSRSNDTPGYRLTFRVIDCKENNKEFFGRLFWHELWLTAPAMPMTKRDLNKLGVTSLEQLEKPLPLGIRCRVKLALRKGDDGSEFNRVTLFEVLGIDPPEVDPFAPADDCSDDQGDDADTSFNFGAAKLQAEGGDQ